MSLGEKAPCLKRSGLILECLSATFYPLAVREGPSLLLNRKGTEFSSWLSPFLLN